MSAPEPGPATPFDLYFHTEFMARPAGQLLEMPDEKFCELISDDEIRAVEAKLLKEILDEILSKDVEVLREYRMNLGRKLGAVLSAFYRLARQDRRTARIARYVRRAVEIARTPALWPRYARYFCRLAEGIYGPSAPARLAAWESSLLSGRWEPVVTDLLEWLLGQALPARLEACVRDLLYEIRRRPRVEEYLGRAEELRGRLGEAGLDELKDIMKEAGDLMVRQARSIVANLFWLRRLLPDRYPDWAPIFEKAREGIRECLDRLKLLKSKIGFLDKLLGRPYDLKQADYHIYIYHSEPDQKKKTKVGLFEGVFLVDVLEDRETKMYVLDHPVTKAELKRCMAFFMATWKGFTTFILNRARLHFEEKDVLKFKTWLDTLHMEGRISEGFGEHSRLERLPMGAVYLIPIKRVYGREWTADEARAGTGPKTLLAFEIEPAQDAVRKRVLKLAEDITKMSPEEFVRMLKDEFWSLSFYEDPTRWPREGVKPERLYIQWAAKTVTEKGVAISGVVGMICANLPFVLGISIEQEELMRNSRSVTFGGDKFKALIIYPLTPDEKSEWPDLARTMMADKAREKPYWEARRRYVPGAEE